MPEKQTVRKAKRQLGEGKSPSTAAGEFVREEIEHVRRGKHGARSTQQAIAIGLSKARRSGIPLPAPEPGQARSTTRRSAQRDLKAGKKRKTKRKASTRRSKATSAALKREPRRAASRKALSRQAKRTTAQRERTRRRNAAQRGRKASGRAQRSGG